METESSVKRLVEKTPLHKIQAELREGYDLSPVESLVLARRVQQLVDEQTGNARQPGQITYQAIALTEPAGKPLRLCRKVAVHLSLVEDDDPLIWVTEGACVLRQVRVHRLTYEAMLQGGALSQEDLACILGLSLRTVKRICAHFRRQDQPLPTRGELCDIGPGVSHKIPVVRRYVQDVSLTRISHTLAGHGIQSMARYLRHFALVMVLQDHGLTCAQMQSVIGISENLIVQYQALYAELNVPAYERTLQRLKQGIHPTDSTEQENTDQTDPETADGEKGGTR
jgi:hypothetical protein